MKRVESVRSNRRKWRVHERGFNSDFSRLQSHRQVYQIYQSLSSLRILQPIRRIRDPTSAWSGMLFGVLYDGDERGLINRSMSTAGVATAFPIRKAREFAGIPAFGMMCMGPMGEVGLRVFMVDE